MWTRAAKYASAVRRCSKAGQPKKPAAVIGVAVETDAVAEIGVAVETDVVAEIGAAVETDVVVDGTSLHLFQPAIFRRVRANGFGALFSRM
jgi:hypothetical protein